MDPIQFLSTVLRVVQAHFAWCSALSGARRRLKCVTIFRMQWYASLNPVMAFLTDATPAHEFGSM